MTATQTVEPTLRAVQRQHAPLDPVPPARSILYMEVIKTIVEEISTFDALQPLLDYVVAALQYRLDFYIASIFRYDHAQQAATLVAQEGQSHHPAPLGYRQPVRVGLLGRALHAQETVLVNDLRYAADYVPPAGYAPAAAELCVPIWSGGALWGAFNVESDVTDAFIHDDHVALEVIAAQLGSALANLDLRAQQQAAFDDLAAHAERQRQLLEQVQQLATPVFTLAPGVLALPLIGTLDSERMRLTLTTLLAAITRTHSARVIIDVSGITLIDQAVASAIARMTQASRLLGAEMILTGMRPEVARALVTSGGDLSSMTVRTDFAGGLAYATRQR